MDKRKNLDKQKPLSANLQKQGKTPARDRALLHSQFETSQSFIAGYQHAAQEVRNRQQRSHVEAYPEGSIEQSTATFPYNPSQQELLQYQDLPSANWIYAANNPKTL